MVIQILHDGRIHQFHLGVKKTPILDPEYRFGIPYAYKTNMATTALVSKTILPNPFDGSKSAFRFVYVWIIPCYKCIYPEVSNVTNAVDYCNEEACKQAAVSVSGNNMGGGNGRYLRKSADQRHRPARFPLAKLEKCFQLPDNIENSLALAIFHAAASSGILSGRIFLENWGEAPVCHFLLPDPSQLPPFSSPCLLQQPENPSAKMRNGSHQVQLLDSRIAGIGRFQWKGKHVVSSMLTFDIVNIICLYTAQSIPFFQSSCIQTLVSPPYFTITAAHDVTFKTSQLKKVHMPVEGCHLAEACELSFHLSFYAQRTELSRISTVSSAIIVVRLLVVVVASVQKIGLPPQTFRDTRLHLTRSASSFSRSGAANDVGVAELREFPSTVGSEQRDSRLDANPLSRPGDVFRIHFSHGKHRTCCRRLKVTQSLWDIKATKYRHWNTNYDELRKIFNHHTVDVEDISKLITQFRGEYKKQQSKQKSGVGVMSPSTEWFAFKSLTFLFENSVSRGSRNSIDLMMSMTIMMRMFHIMMAESHPQAFQPVMMNIQIQLANQVLLIDNICQRRLPLRQKESVEQMKGWMGKTGIRDICKSTTGLMTLTDGLSSDELPPGSDLWRPMPRDSELPTEVRLHISFNVTPPAMTDWRSRVPSTHDPPHNLLLCSNYSQFTSCFKLALNPCDTALMKHHPSPRASECIRPHLARETLVFLYPRISTFFTEVRDSSDTRCHDEQLRVSNQQRAGHQDPQFFYIVRESHINKPPLTLLRRPMAGNAHYKSHLSTIHANTGVYGAVGVAYSSDVGKLRAPRTKRGRDPEKLSGGSGERGEERERERERDGEIACYPSAAPLAVAGGVAFQLSRASV
ncbi:hypothetical protein PR048_008951 [Dryococelus australis]|uniref:MADF domain-containing protein n=1 Tax=Dryococelus australis TaxID=614101 RepID=A0ABQ9HYJ8_9NEOP|nr:hypothetical protein PR048_008951 [Dryococelus australis]